MTTSSNGLLAPRPPNLFPIAERQAFSGSSASYSSSSSSSTSADFGRLSRNSSGSAYLTDLTPPVSPSQSKSDLKLSASVHGGVRSMYSSRSLKFDRLSKEQANRHNNIAPHCSEMGDMRDAGYSTDNESDEVAFDTVEALTTKLGRARQSINTRRALQIMERRSKAKTSTVERDRPRMSSMSSKVIITEVGSQGSADWSQEYASTCTIYQTPQASTERVSALSSVEDLQDSTEAPSDFLLQDWQGSLDHQDNAISLSPQMPPKPVLRPMELAGDCSPLSLYSQDLSSSTSISLLLLSPPDLRDSDPDYSPAIWNESFAHGNSPLFSPVEAISTRVFSSQNNRRTSPVALTGEDLDVGSLMRLETATALGIQSTPNFRATSSSIQSNPLPGSPYYEESWEARDDPSFSRRYVEALFSVPSEDDLPTSNELSGLLFDKRCTEEADQPVVGLGLGNLAESSLCSSASISHLQSSSNEGDDGQPNFRESGTLDDRMPSIAAVSSTSPAKSAGQCEIEPPGALSHQLFSCAIAPGDVPLSPILNLPDKQKKRPQSPRFKESKPVTRSRPVIEPPALQAKPRVQVPFSHPKTMRRRDFVKHRSSMPSFRANSQVLLPEDSATVLDNYAKLDNLELRHSPLRPSASMQEKKHSTLDESRLESSSSSSSIFPTVKCKSDSQDIHEVTTPVRLSGLPSLQGNEPAEKPRLNVEIGICGHSHRSFPLATSQPYRDSRAEKSTFLHPDSALRRDRNDYCSSPRSSSFLLTPKNDPRSPCSPSVEYFRRGSSILGGKSASSISSFSSKAPSSGPSPPIERVAPLSPSVSFRLPPLGIPAKSAEEEGPTEFKNADDIGMGLPSYLASRPPRQRASSSSSLGALTNGPECGMLPPAASCQNLVQSVASRSSDLDGHEAGADAAFDLGADLGPLYKIRKFAKRCLFAIPEQATPSPTFSPSRLRIATPFSPFASPKWPDLSMLNRLRSPKSLSRSSSSASSLPSPLGENMTGASAETLHIDKEKDLSPKSAPLMGPAQTPPMVTSPGIIEHPNAPKGMKFFKRLRQNPPSGPESTRSRSPFRRFQVLF